MSEWRVLAGNEQFVQHNRREDRNARTGKLEPSFRTLVCTDSFILEYVEFFLKRSNLLLVVFPFFITDFLLLRFSILLPSFDFCLNPLSQNID